MALATLSIDLEARLARLEGDLGRAVSAVDRSSKRMATSFSAVDKTLVNLRSTLISAFAATSIVQGIQGIVTGLEKLVDISEVTGASIENISGLEDVARRTGTSIETVETSLVKLNAVLKEADGKNAQSQALKAIGLEAEALKRLDPAQALLSVSIALGRFADDGNKARIVQELFGKSVKEVGPLLKDLADKGAINATVTADQARAAQQFSDSISSLIKNLTDVARVVAGPVLSALNEFFQRIKDIQATTGSSLGLAGAGLRGINTLEINKSNEALTETVNQIKALNAVIDENKKNKKPLSLSAGLIEQVRELEGVERFLRLQQSRQGGRGSQGRGLELPELKFPEPKTGGGARARQSIAAEGKFETSDLEKYIEKLQEAAKATQDLTAVEKLSADLADGSLQIDIRNEKIRDRQIAQLTEAAEKFDALKTAKENDAAVTRQNQKVEEEYNKRKQDAIDTLNRLLEDTPTGQREELLRIEKLLTEEYEKQGGASGESSKKFLEALGIVKEKLEELGKPIKKTGDDMTDFAKRAAENIQDQLGDTLVRILDGDFKNIGRLWKQMLDRLVAEALAAKLLKALFPDGVEKGLGKLFGLIFGGDKTIGSTDPLGTGFDPSTGGKFSGSIPGSSKSGFGAQKSSAVYNYNVAAGVSRSEVLSALQLVRDQARADTSMALRRAGVA